MIRALAEDLAARRRSPLELVEETLDAIARTSDRLNTFITVDAERAREAARGMKVPGGGPLAGIPVAHKDLIATAGVRTTAGSKILGDWVPRRDAPLVRALREAGAIMVGKTNTHEFAFGTTNDNPHYGATGNPWAPHLTTGGSSGGSAAAVSAGIVPLASGSDTAGSIRIPAALCGVVGLKPTYGLVPIRGVVPLAPTFDTAGPIAGTVEDAALGLEGMTGLQLAVKAPETLKGLTIGVPERFVFDKVDPEVEASVREALRVLEVLGARVIVVEVPELADVVRTGISIVRPEALAFHSRWYPSRAHDYGEDVARSLEAATRIPGAEYVAARATRRRVSRALRRVLRQVDLLAGPTVPILAFENRLAFEPVAPGGDLPRFALTRLTYPFSLSRLPAISIPCGLSKPSEMAPAGLPIALQLAAGPFEEEFLLGVASAYERARGELPEPPFRA
jgi:aspartyl-tRNA(Asn)/glutamyl-tRNA(Gln) amidotransferase subunit A